jgi:formylglycine-generating enzyme required for sulfatase activity
VADWYDPNYYASSPTNDPTGPTTGQYRGLRGGSWYYSSVSARAAYRHDYFYLDYPDDHYDNRGFRVVVVGGVPLLSH